MGREYTQEISQYIHMYSLVRGILSPFSPPLLLLLLVYTSCVLAESFDPEQEQYCLKSTGGCSYTNSSIWMERTVPNGTYTHVFIVGSGSHSSPLLIYFNASSLNIENLTLENSEFVMMDGNLTVGNINAGDNSSLILQSPSYTTAQTDNITLLTNTNLFIGPTATLIVEDGSSLVWPFVASLFGTVFFNTAQELFLYKVEYAAVTASFAQLFSVPCLTVLPNISAQFSAGLQVTQMTASAGSISLVQGSFSGGLVVEAGATVNFYSTSGSISLSGLGNVNIYGSQLELANIETTTPPVFYGTLSLFGTSQIYFTNFNAPNINFDATASVIVTANGLVLSGTTNVYGTLIATQSGINITGDVTVYGSVVLSNSRMVVANGASLGIPAETFLTADNATLMVAGVFDGSLSIPEDGRLLITGNASSILGDLQNSGFINCGENRLLNVYGSFVQDGNGTLLVQLFDLNLPPVLIIGASEISLAGKMHYRFVKKPPHAKKFEVLSAIQSANITGTFSGSAVPTPGSLVTHNLGLQYTNSSVILVYKPDLPGWVWGIVGVAIAIVIISVGIGAFIYLKRRAVRGEYDTL